MAKRVCSDYKELKKKIKKAEAVYICMKCDRTSPREKWVCKPKPL